MAETTTRGVRISDDLWNRASQVAKENGETISGVIRRLLTAYVKDAS